MPEIKRQTAYKVTISQLNTGKYIVQQGWDPNYIEQGDLKISRVNLMAVLVTKGTNVLTLDDGTGKIDIRLFTDQEKADNLNVGDVILIVGRPREYQNKRYIVPEILKRVDNKKWIDFRKQELIDIPTTEPKEQVTEVKVEDVEESPKQNYSFKIIQAIKKLDTGDGADTDKVIKECGVEDAENHIETLLNEGEIFEIRAGKLKVLE